MAITTAGLTALLNDGSDAVVYVAIGDGPTSSDQVSAARVLITWDAAASSQLSAADLPYQFTGPNDGDATHMLFFSAATAGTFYGSEPLDGDQVFNSAGEFEITALVLAGSSTDPDVPVVPTAAFTSGTEVGVPTGTTLTTRTTLGSANGGSETYTITHPVSGATADLTVSVWQNLRFTQTFTVSPPSGQHYLFRNCRWDVDATAWTVEVDQANGVNNQMAPVVIFDHCSFQGNGNSNIGVAGSFCWLIECDIEGMVTASPASGASDGWQGAAYSVAIRSNLVAGTNEDLPDPHSDGTQNTGTGHTTLYNCWCSAGGSDGANSAIRFGTEDGAVSVIEIYYCGLDDGGYALQVRGDAGAGDISDFTAVGNRWTRDAVYGPTDFVEVTDVTWTDNAFFDGEEIPSPV
jgi:hypothetical protein